MEIPKRSQTIFLGMLMIVLPFVSGCEKGSLITYENSFTIPSYNFAGKMYVHFLRSGKFQYNVILLGLNPEAPVSAKLTADAPIYLFQDNSNLAAKLDTVNLDDYSKRFSDKYEAKILYVCFANDGELLLYRNDELIFSLYVPIGKEPEQDITG